MKRIKLSLVFVLIWAGLTGCASRTVYVMRPPPPSRVEVRVAKPAPHAVWIPGRWIWKRSRYVWMAGYWEVKPKGKVWVPGHWQKRPRGWVWIPGHWGR